MTLDLDQRLRHLRLSGMAIALPVRNQEAIHHHLAYTDFLELLSQGQALCPSAQAGWHT